MRKVLTVVIAVLVIAAMLAPPAHAQAPASKVTIQGLIDNVASYANNMSIYDLNLQRRDKEMYARTRARPDIIGEVGTSKFVLGLEFDYSYGQISSNNDQNSGLTNLRGSERFGSSSGGTLNTDLARLVEVKWAYTEFDLPLPMATRLRIGAQPFDATYKQSIYANSDFTGFNLDTTLSPMAKLHLTYVFITDRGTGRGDGFLQGESFAAIADPEITLMKGIDIRPIYSYMFIGGASSSSYSGPRLGRGGVANGRCAGQDASLTVTPATGTGVAGTSANTTTLPGGFGAPAAAPCFPDGAKEDRSTVGIDARIRMGAFSFDPTFLYQFGQRDLVSAAPFKYAGIRHAQQENAWIVDLRGGWQAGPLLLELAGIYTTGNKARQDVRDSNRAVHFFQPLVTDSGYYSGWSEIWGLGVDYFHQLRNNAAGMSPGVAIGYDKYGLGRIGTRATYALTPTFSLRSNILASWAAEPVDTRGTVGGAGIVPNASGTAVPLTGSHGTNQYLGTEIDVGLVYKLAPGVTFDLVAAYEWSGHAQAYAFATDIPGGDGAAITRPAMNPKDVQTVAARFRYAF
jgi:hypothetical protein